MTGQAAGGHPAVLCVDLSARLPSQIEGIDKNLSAVDAPGRYRNREHFRYVMYCSQQLCLAAASQLLQLQATGARSPVGTV